MKQTFLQLLKKAFLAGGLSSLVNVSLATVASSLLIAPPTFPPFSVAPILAGCFVGSILATVVYYFVQGFPRWVYGSIVVFSLILSFYLPYRIGYSSSLRFAGVTFSIQLVLCLMHSIVAGITTFLFWRDRIKSIQTN